MTALTFIVPTIPGRESLLSRCLWSIQNQAHDEYALPETLVVAGTAGLGAKVNAAVPAATGEYVTVVDDDDWLMAHYVRSVTPLSGDYVGVGVIELHNGQYRQTSATYGDSNRWGGGRRGPTPKGIIRRAIAEKIRMGDEWRADRNWLAEAVRLISVSDTVEDGLYVYDAWDASSAFGGHAHRDVGVWPFDESKVRRMVVDR